MTYDFFALTDTGRVRQNNEDSVAFDAEIGLGLLADGMGGYNAGEVASEMATRVIAAELGRRLMQAGPQLPAREVRRAMEASVDQANHAIYEASNSIEQYAGMGTTLVMGVFQAHRLLLGHVGDSRCYRWRDGVLTLLTRDHSLLQEQLDAGVITPEQAVGSANRNLVTRALGVEDAVLLETHEHRVEPDDIYLLCSDGLTDMLSDPVLAAHFADGGGLEALAARLIESANTSGGRDNVSVMLVNASQSTKKRGLMARLLGK